MTIMQGAIGTVLYPPYDDDSSSSNQSGEHKRERDGTALGTSAAACGSSDRSSSKQKRPPSSSTTTRRSDSGSMSAKLAENFEVLKRAKLERGGSGSGAAAVDESYRGLAAETAKLANAEIARMERAVAELEALVREKGGGGNDEDGGSGSSNNINPQQQQLQLERFPSLPKVIEIPHDDDDEEEEEAGSAEGNCSSAPSPSIVAGQRL